MNERCFDGVTVDPDGSASWAIWGGGENGWVIEVTRLCGVERTEDAVERRDRAADVRREMAGDGGAGREELSEARWMLLSDVASESWAGGSGIVTCTGGCCAENDCGVGVTGGELGTAMVGVVTSPSGNAAPLASSFDLRLVALLRMICSMGESLLANSCGLSFGGGRKGDPGDGNGEVDGGTDSESRGASADERRVRRVQRHARA